MNPTVPTVIRVIGIVITLILAMLVYDQLIYNKSCP